MEMLEILSAVSCWNLLEVLSVIGEQIARWPPLSGRVSAYLWSRAAHSRELEDYGSMARKITNLFWTNFAGSRLPGGAVGRGLSVN